MKHFDVFNGDADGICALAQLRLAQPLAPESDWVLVTGFKRDISLLDRVEAASGDRVCVLDVSFDKNRAGLLRALEAGASVRYFDHHRATDLPEHPQFESHIDTAADVCTSILVDRSLGGAQRAWAIVGAFGDNLDDSARRLAASGEWSDAELDALRDLGRFLNYNAYGRSVDDLHFAPAALLRRVLRHGDPRSFIADDDAFTILRDGFASDMARAEGLAPASQDAAHAVFVLPDEAWAARISGVFANRLARAHRERAHALLTEGEESYVVSVRAPKARPEGADELCSRFPTGGGRKAAAGINALPHHRFDDFVEAFRTAYR